MVLARVGAIVDATSPVIEGADFRDAVITGLPHTIELCRRDKLFMKLLSLPREKRLGELVGDPSGFGFDMVERLWLPAVRRARGRRAGGKRVVDGGGETSFDISDFSAPDAGYSGKTIFFTASWIDSAGLAGQRRTTRGYVTTPHGSERRPGSQPGRRTAPSPGGSSGGGFAVEGGLRESRRAGNGNHARTVGLERDQAYGGRSTTAVDQ